MSFSFNYVFGMFYIVTFVQGSTWSAWEPCSKTCSGGVQKRTLNCTSTQQTAQEWRDKCTNNKMTQTRNCKNRPCSDFALKCYQCQGSEVYCHQNKLKRNQTQDACNKYNDRCITKRFELDVGVSEVTRGCGREVECRVMTNECMRKSYHKCHVICCEEDYCNSGHLLGGWFGDSLVIMFGAFLSFTMYLH
ncbi:hypothetical protein OS493_003809 [Desmophyllum pertusum]|uniref:Uncharacterized protein n=1 Tax=Desmophyllum pertusum TaxID=174260 RepID=A0A9X0A633_9CNID|nr:hypothetical protein OS493_003809 [Desmophyllum pertusum]